MRPVQIVAALLSLGALCSCGGGGGNGGSVPVTTVQGATFQITWPARTRQALQSSLTSALSVSVTVAKADGTAGVTINVDRSSTNLASYTGTYTISQAIPLASSVLSANFYSFAAEKGVVVGSATAAASFVGKYMSFSDIVLSGVIRSVTPMVTNLVVGGKATQFGFSAADANGNTLAVTPGSARWTVTSGTTFLTITPDGIATPVAAGMAAVTTSVDGITSPAASVTVAHATVANATFQITWPARSRGALQINLSSAIAANVTLANVDGSDPVTTIALRGSSLGAQTGTYTLPKSLDTTASVLTATFYAAVTNGAPSGAVVGTASAATSLTGSSVNIADVVVSGTVKQVAAIAQTLQVGGPTGQLLFSTTDAAGNVVAVSAGSAFWAVKSGGNYLSLTQDGIATPISAGTAMVTATVDNITSAGVSIVVNPVATTSWFKFRGNAFCTGQVGGSGSDGTVIATTALPNGGWPDPCISPSGVVYIGSSDSNLYAIKGGTVLWKFKTGADIEDGAAIGTDGTIYVGSQDHIFYAVSPSGTQKWQFPTGNAISASPALAKDGTIYIGSEDGNLYALSPSGTLKWQFQTGTGIWASPAVGSDGTIYFGGQQGSLFALNPDGSQRWAFSGAGPYMETPAIGTDGTIYDSDDAGILYAINPNGTQKWAYSGLSGNGGLHVSSPGIGSNGNIYVGSLDGRVIAVNPAGAQVWSYSTGTDIVQSSPAIGSDGVVYMQSRNGNVYALNSDGSLKWSAPNGGNPSSLTLGSDGTVYVVSVDNNLYAIGSKAGLARARPRAVRK